MHPEIEAILTERGAIKRSRHPQLRSALHRAKQSGDLIVLLPGTYVASGGLSPLGWLQAIAAWSEPHGVFHARTAAALWLPVERPRLPQLAHPSLRGPSQVEISRRPIPREFIVERHGLRVASPSFAAAELAAVDDGKAICDALRLRLADPRSLRTATRALAGTLGQETRMRVVRSAAANPWSYAELRLHRILRAAGVLEWVANRPLLLAGRKLHPDLRLLRRKLIVEFDGREHHDTPGTFLSDRERLNILAAAGYLVLRFGWEHLDEPDHVVNLVRQAMRVAAPYG